MLPGGTLSGARPPGKPEVARVTFQKNNCGMGLSIVAAKGESSNCIEAIQNLTI